MERSTRTRLMGAIGVAMLGASLVGPAASAQGGGPYHIGISNTLQGNGWREEMICSMKAQAKVSGEVEKMTIINRTAGTPEQIEDIRTLMSAGVNAIIVNPTDREALNEVITEAIGQDIVVVAVDQAVTQPDAYVLANDQTQYAYLGATWLFQQLGGEGSVLYMRGIEGVPADTDRDTGFQKALAENPGITVAQQTFTGWAQLTGFQQMAEILNSGIEFDGIWTSGIDNVIVEAFKVAQRPYVPIVGADNNAFVGYLNTEKANGLTGVAVTNPPPVGGAGVALALKVLNGETVERENILTPELWDNQVESDMTDKIIPSYDVLLAPTYGVNYTLPPWTTYTKSDLLSCEGPATAA